jgi:preprotein translocase subunit SecA
VEAQNFDTRKNILKYDDVMSRQREVIYTERRQVLEGEDMQEWVHAMIGEVTGAYITGATEGFPEEWDLEQLWTALGTLYPIGLTIEGVEAEAGGREGLSREYLHQVITDDARAAYTRREEELGAPVMRELERRVVLSVLDRKWREHLYEMDYLREGIGLRAYSQRDPLVEYQREGFDLFTAMMDAIAEESVGFLFNLDVQVEPAQEAAAPADSVGAQPQLQLQGKGLQQRKSAQKLSYSAPSEGGDVEVRADEDTGGEPGVQQRQRQTNVKNKNRQKAKQQRKSRKKNR